MTTQRLDNAHIAIVDGNPAMRASLKRTLQEAHAQSVTDCADFDAMVRALDDITVDLLMCDAELPGGDVCEMVQRLRNHAVGRNPFLAVIATTSVAEAMSIQRILGSGVDDLLIKPVPMEIVVDRVVKLVDTRKPFVITHNYIGPDRRGGLRHEEKNPLVPIDVPNTLKTKIHGITDSSELTKMVDGAVAMLNTKKMERYSVEIAYLVKRVHTGIKHHKSVFEMKGDLERLTFVSKDLQRRMAGTSAEHAAHLAGSIVTVAERAGKAAEGPTARDVELLSHLAAAIRHAFVQDPNAVDAAMEITDTIAKFAGKI
jgi:DNA-binding response OmpR family regulator